MTDILYIEVYPRLGTTYPDAAGDPITAAGAIVPSSKYIQDALRAGPLLSNDPLDVYNPDGPRVPPEEGGSGSLEVVLASDLSTAQLEPDANGKLSVTSGIATVTDGDVVGTTQGTWYYNSASSATVDSGLVRATSSGIGRWLRQRERDVVNVKWFGAKGDGSTDDTAAIQAAQDACTPYVSELYFPAGHYRITDTLFFTKSGIRIKGEAGSTGGFMGTWLLWDGAADSVMTCYSGADFVTEGMQWVNYQGNICESLVALGNLTAPFVSSTNMSFIRCKWTGGQYGVSFDPNGISLGNIDFMRFTECRWEANNTGVWIHGGQPFGIVFTRCTFTATDRSVSPSRVPYGVGVWFDCGTGGSLFFNDCNFSYLTLGVYMTQGCPVVIQNSDSEAVKRLFYAAILGGANLPFLINGGRLDASAVIDGLTGYMYNPADDIPGSDRSYIKAISGNVTVRGVNFLNSYTEGLFEIYVRGECNIVSEGNIYPNARPFMREQTVATPATPGCTYSLGDQCAVIDVVNPAVSLSPCPQLKGTENPGGSVTISDAATTAAVTFHASHPELSTNVADPTLVKYRVSLTVEPGAGTPTFSHAWVSGRTTTGFTINLGAAPGMGNSVIVNYELFR